MEVFVYRLTGKSARVRIGISRTGVRVRRLPTVCLPRGVAIKVHPGRSVDITREDLLSNVSNLEPLQEMFTLTEVGAPTTQLLLADVLSSPPASVTEPESELVIELTEPEPEPVIELTEPEPEPVIELTEPEPEPVIEPAPAPKKRSRKKSDSGSETPSPRKRRSRAKKVD